MMGRKGMDQRIAEAIRSVSRGFAARLVAQRKTFNAALTLARRGPLDDTVASDVATEAHRIAGIAGTLGFGRLSRLAGAVENAVLIHRQGGPARGVAVVLAALLREIDQIRDQAAAAA